MTTISAALRARSLPDGLRWGVGLAVLAALISGVSIFVNASAVKAVPDTAVYTTLKNGIAGFLLIMMAGATLRPGALRNLDRRTLLALAAIGVIGGSVPFLLFFTGLAQASAPTAAFIQKTLFVWVAILAVPFLGERLGLAQLGALAVLFVGMLLIAPPTGVKWGTGESMIAAATLLWSVETVIARRLLARASAPMPPQLLGAARLGFGLIVLIGYVVVTGRGTVVAALSGTQWLVAGGTGLLLAAYVATWFAALRRAPASLVTAVLVIGAPVTAALQALVNGKVPAGGALGGELLVLSGALIMATAALRSRRSAAQAVAPAGVE